MGIAMAVAIAVESAPGAISVEASIATAMPMPTPNSLGSDEESQYLWAGEAVQRLNQGVTRPEGPAVKRPGRQAGIGMEHG